MHVPLEYQDNMFFFVSFIIKWLGIKKFVEAVKISDLGRTKILY